MKVICVNDTGAALTVGRVYEARRAVNWFYLRVTDDNGRVGTFSEKRFYRLRESRAFSPSAT